MYRKLNEDEEYNMFSQTDELTKEDTGLPVNIWIHCNSILEIPVVSFENDYDMSHTIDDYNTLISISIEDQQVLLNSDEKLKIKEDEVQKIQEWIKPKANSLLKYWNGDIDTLDFLRENNVTGFLRNFCEELIK